LIDRIAYLGTDDEEASGEEHGQLSFHELKADLDEQDLRVC
jgi:hypothetical protein